MRSIIIYMIIILFFLSCGDYRNNPDVQQCESGGVLSPFFFIGLPMTFEDYKRIKKDDVEFQSLSEEQKYNKYELSQQEFYLIFMIIMSEDYCNRTYNNRK
ncbi:MAG: hypothetical protein KatS3mg002_1718 [Candidatus Woesearchaeota archaeon]|nr:MAG: hypothetical protein KatS3mg002_1718 [Candidatus Woesearchaeota archaeon]